MKRLLLSMLLATTATVHAQPVATATAAPAAPSVSLEDAYKREFALLEAQKRELQVRLADTKRQFAAERERLQRDTGTLEGQVLLAQAEAERRIDALARAEQQEQAGVDDRELIEATLEQARSTLGGFGHLALAQAADQPGDAQLQIAFDAALETLRTLGSVQAAPGAFFLPDGSEVQGTLIRFGNIAAFAVSDAASGALVPAGGGRFRLFNAPQAADTAQALATAQHPGLLRAYLFENADVAVIEPEAKTIGGEIAKGGMIGVVILLLGLLALVLVALRAVFLQRAGASIGAILDAVQPAMHAGADQAIAAVKRFKGSAARVVTAALRNIDRDREHLEDIVSESILHESSRLARFGAVIMTVAAVAPLLGLLGTVTGMIQTFDVITEFGTSDPKLLSGGIATALVTTELGLIVAIPCLLAGSLLNGWAERIKDDMEKAALRVITLAHGARVVRDAAVVRGSATVA